MTNSLDFCFDSVRQTFVIHAEIETRHVQLAIVEMINEILAQLGQSLCLCHANLLNDSCHRGQNLSERVRR